MLLKLSGHISKCLERAADAERRAVHSTDPATRSDSEFLAQSWQHLARSYQFVESVERFLSDTSRGTAATVRPEILADVEEQAEAPAGQPIARRRRVKHETSFNDRLLKSAHDAREQAACLPPGAARDRLLEKARQTETAATIDTWISSPGPRPPDNSDPTRKTRA